MVWEIRKSELLKPDDLKIWKCENLEIWKLEIWKSENLKIWNLKIWEFENLKIRNLIIGKSEIWKSENLKIWKSENLKIWKSENLICLSSSQTINPCWSYEWWSHNNLQILRWSSADRIWNFEKYWGKTKAFLTTVMLPTCRIVKPSKNEALESQQPYEPLVQSLLHRDYPHSPIWFSVQLATVLKSQNQRMKPRNAKHILKRHLGGWTSAGKYCQTFEKIQQTIQIKGNTLKSNEQQHVLGKVNFTNSKRQTNLGISF